MTEFPAHACLRGGEAYGYALLQRLVIGTNGAIMSLWRMPKPWRNYIANVDRALKDAHAPRNIRKGICEDIEDYLAQLSTERLDMKVEDLASLLDPPQAYAAEFARAMGRQKEEGSGTVIPERGDESSASFVPQRLRHCQSQHGEDGKRCIHICGCCLHVFYNCQEYETHSCSDEPGTPTHWSRATRWGSAVILAAVLFLPIYGCFGDWFKSDRCDIQGKNRHHIFENQAYLRSVQTSIITFEMQYGRMPESLREVSNAELMNRGWVLPGDVKDLGHAGGFPLGRVTYLYAEGAGLYTEEASVTVSTTRQPILIYPQRFGRTREICIDVAYADGEIMHYSSIDDFLNDWESKR